MVTEAANTRSGLYTIIGVPLTGGDPGAVGDFIDQRQVGSIVHLIDSDRLWSHFGVLGMPGWATITASGQTTARAGSLPRSVLDGDWVD